MFYENPSSYQLKANTIYGNFLKRSKNVLINNQDVDIHEYSVGSHPCPKCKILLYLKGRLILGHALDHNGLCHRLPAGSQYFGGHPVLYTNLVVKGAKYQNVR